MRALLPVCLLLVLLPAACARPVGGLAEPSGGYASSPQRVQVKATEVRFTPERIAVKLGTPVEVAVDNTAGVEQNITIRDPQGRVLASQGLPAGSRQTVRFTPYSPGIYTFYATKGPCARRGASGEFIADGSAESG